MKKFEARFLSKKDFEAAAKSDPRYSNVLTSDYKSLAFADPDKGKVFIRYTQWPEVNRMLLHHEMDHLVEEHGTDEDEFGIRHKRGAGHFFLQAARQVAPFLGVPGGIGGQFAQEALKGQSLTHAMGRNMLAGGAEGALTTAGALGGSPASLGAGRAAGSAVSDAITGRPGIGKRALTEGLSTTALATGAQAAGGGGFNPFGSFFTGVPPPGMMTLGTKIAGTPTATIGSVHGFSPPRSNLGGGLGGGGIRGLQATESGLSSDISTQLANSGVSPGTGAGASTAASRPGGWADAFKRISDSGWAGGPGGPAGGGGPPTPPSPPPQSGGLGGFVKDLGKQAATQSILSKIGSLFGFGEKGPGQQINHGIVAAGIGTALGGQAGVKTPEVPELGQIPDIQAIRQGAQAGGLTAAGRAAEGTLSQNLSERFQGLPPDVQSSIQRQFDVERRNVASQFKQFRPGADLATDSDFRRVMQDVDARQAETVANAQLTYRQQFNQKQTADLQAALGIDQQTFQELATVAQADIATIMTRLGISAQAAQSLKNTFGQLGGTMVAAGLGLNSFNPPPTINVNNTPVRTTV